MTDTDNDDDDDDDDDNNNDNNDNDNNDDNDDNDDDNNDNDELADEVVPNQGLSNALYTDSEQASSSKRKVPLKRGRMSAKAREDIRAFSTQVLQVAQELADHHMVSRRALLIAAGLGIKESHSSNITNLHAQWYVATHTKPGERAYFCTSSIPF